MSAAPIPTALEAWDDLSVQMARCMAAITQSHLEPDETTLQASTEILVEAFPRAVNAWAVLALGERYLDTIRAVLDLDEDGRRIAAAALERAVGGAS